MSWWGKVIGGAFGFMLGGPLGALLGAAFGHQFDRGLKLVRQGDFTGSAADHERIQMAFFTATFTVMGHLAKADGRVSENEIDVARAIMAQMALTAEQRRVAIDLFNRGKQPEFDLEAVLDQFKQECHRRRTLLQMFIEIQLHAAYADGVVHPDEKRVLLQVCERLGFSRLQYQHLEAMVRAQRHFYDRERPGAAVPPTRDLLEEAYAVLGVPAGASDAEVKKAYRRLMNQHHPDKLTAKGLPQEMVQMATVKTQEIKAAYEQVKKARGLK